MDFIALLVSMFALALAGIAYFRSGGREDLRAAEERLRQSLVELNRVTREASEHLLERLRAGYQSSLRTIELLQSELAELRSRAAAELNAELDALAATLDQLAERSERQLSELKHDLGETVVAAEAMLRRAVDEARARLQVLEAEQELALARADAGRGNLDEARSHIGAAISHLKDARLSSAQFTENVASLQNEAQRLLELARIEAREVEMLMQRNNRLLAAMSGASADGATRRAFAAGRSR